MTTPDESKLSKARKLLGMAEGAATPAEAETFAEKAMQYMAEHGIEQAMLEKATDGKIETETIKLVGSYTREKVNLLGAIADAKRCRVTFRHRGRVATSATLTGFASDRQTVLELYRSLVIQADRGVSTAYPGYWSDESVTSFRRTWMVGFAVKVGHRLAAAEAAATAEADAGNLDAPAPSQDSSAALVLRSRDELVKAAYEEAFPNVKQAKSRQLSGTGMAAGIQAGARADLGGHRLTSGQKALGR